MEKPSVGPEGPLEDELFKISEDVRNQIISAASKDGSVDTDLLIGHLAAHVAIGIVRMRHLEHQFKNIDQAFRRIAEITTQPRDYDIPKSDLLTRSGKDL